MRTILRRIEKLEKRAQPVLDESGVTILERLEQGRLRLEAAGLRPLTAKPSVRYLRGLAL